METLKKLFKNAGFTVLGLFVAFMIYANWEEPPLSDRLNIKPIELAVYHLNKDISVEDSLQIAQKLTANKGLTALVEDLQASLVKFSVESRTKIQLLGALGGMRGDIVGQ